MQHIITDDELAALRAAPLKTIRDFRRLLGHELMKPGVVKHGIGVCDSTISLEALKKVLDAAEDSLTKSIT